MDNSTIQTDLAQILNKLDGKIDRIDDRLGKLEIGQVEIKCSFGWQANFR